MKRLVGRIWGGGLKTALIAGLVAVLVSATTVVAASDFLTKEKYREKEGIFATFKKDAIIPTSSLGRIASLPLGTGKYAIQAKLSAFNLQTGREEVRCQLAADPPGATDAVVDETYATIDDSFGSAALPLQVVLTFTAPGNVVLRCSSEDPGTSAGFIKITAVRARKLVNAPSP